MTAIDANVAIAALLDWHEVHLACSEIARGASIPAHALIETYSVLTRLPDPHRLHSRLVSELLAIKFPPERVLVPSPQLQTGIIARFSDGGIEGGASYDALIALTAADHGVRLATCDSRAARTYDVLGIGYDLVGTNEHDH